MIGETVPSPSALAVTRVRHVIKRRTGEVVRVVPITPELIRITLRGADFSDFDSMSFDDHVKVFFPAPGAGDPVMRDFTPRRFDQAKGELDLEFYLHEAGPATTWAAQARVGQSLVIGGPRGSMIIPAAFDWHLLIGDETALPAIARRLEELPESVVAIVVAEVAGGYAQIDFKSRAAMRVTWIHRDGAMSGLPAAVAALPAFPASEGYAWAAAESSVVRELRAHLVTVRGLDKSRIRAAAYWKRGAQSIHEVLED